MSTGKKRKLRLGVERKLGKIPEHPAGEQQFISRGRSGFLTQRHEKGGGKKRRRAKRNVPIEFFSQIRVPDRKYHKKKKKRKFDH